MLSNTSSWQVSRWEVFCTFDFTHNKYSHLSQ